MGTHASGPSVLASTGQTLASWLADHPEALGDKVIEQFGSKSELPFLFKVLSVNKALSIQAHPNKAGIQTDLLCSVFAYHKFEHTYTQCEEGEMGSYYK